jgi:hypothetical protein
MARRGLILLSKLLQNLASERPFGEKEGPDPLEISLLFCCFDMLCRKGLSWMQST